MDMPAVMVTKGVQERRLRGEAGEEGRGRRVKEE